MTNANQEVNVLSVEQRWRWKKMARLPTYEEMGKKVAEEVLDGYIYKGKTLREWIDILAQTRWIPVSKRLPKENEYIGDVCKYYLIQDEYGDMHVARLSNVGWIPMRSLKAIGDEIIAWMPLPQPYAESEEGNE